MVAHRVGREGQQAKHSPAIGMAQPDEDADRHEQGGPKSVAALAAEPKLIVADEPTTALDVSIQAQIISLLKRLCKEHGAAVMLVTHDMGVIAETCDRVAVMYAGRVAEIGVEMFGRTAALGEGMNIITDFFAMMTIFLAAFFVMLGFFVLALQLFVVLIAFKLGSLAAFVALPWGVFNGTAWVAERPLGWVVGSAVRLFVLAFVASVSITFVNTLPATFTLNAGGVLNIFLFGLTVLALAWFAPMLAAFAADAPVLLQVAVDDQDHTGDHLRQTDEDRHRPGDLRALAQGQHARRGQQLAAGAQNLERTALRLAADQRGHGIGVSLDVYTKSSLKERAEAVKQLEDALFKPKKDERKKAS